MATITESFHVGKKFMSFKELQDCKEMYEMSNLMNLTMRDSKTLEHKNAPTRAARANKELRYCILRLCCSYGGRKSRKHGYGKRETQSRKVGCGMFIRLVLSDDGQSLDVVEMNENHSNHTISTGVSYRCNYCNMEMSGIEDTLTHNCISGCATVFVADKNSLQHIDLAMLASESQEEVIGSIPDQTGKWPAMQTKALLQLISKNRSMLLSRKGELFKKVVEALHDLGFNQSEENILYKWNSLCRKYRKIIKDKKDVLRNGKKSVKWEFFDEMEDIIGKRTSIDCEHTVDSITPSSTTESGTDLDKIRSSKRRKMAVGSTSLENSCSNTRLQKDSEFHDFMMDYLKEMRESEERRSQAEERRHQERMAVEQKKLELLKKLIEKL